MSVEQAKNLAQEEIQKRKDAILDLNHEIHADPEISWEEFRAMERIATFLTNYGFSRSRRAFTDARPRSKQLLAPVT